MNKSHKDTYIDTYNSRQLRCGICTHMQALDRCSLSLSSHQVLLLPEAVAAVVSAAVSSTVWAVPVSPSYPYTLPSVPLYGTPVSLHASSAAHVTAGTRAARPDAAAPQRSAAVSTMSPRHGQAEHTASADASDGTDDDPDDDNSDVLLSSSSCAPACCAAEPASAAPGTELSLPVADVDAAVEVLVVVILLLLRLPLRDTQSTAANARYSDVSIT